MADKALPSGSRMQRLLERGRAAWPDVDVSLELFAKGLAQRVVDADDPMTEAEARAVEDLYLGVACSTGATGALKAFTASVEPALRAMHRRFSHAITYDDFQQILHEKLFAGPRARIHSYAGRGSLKAWVKIVAGRLLADVAERNGRQPDAHGDVLLVATMMPPYDTAKAAIKRQLRPSVEAAISATMKSLSSRQRLLLRQRFLYGLTLAELASLHRVHRVTVSKQLARARADVQARLRERLEMTLGAPPEQVESILRLCASQLDIHFDDLLRSR